MKENINVKKNKKKSNNIFVNMMRDYFDFYKKNLFKKHIVAYIVSLVLFFIFLALFISSSNVSSGIDQATTNYTNMQNMDFFNILFKQNIPIVFLIIFAGITPFVYLPVLGVGVSYVLASNIATIFATTTHSADLVAMTISSIVQLFAYALAVSTGIYYCKLTTMKFRYTQGGHLGVNDVKEKYYELKKDEKKLNEINDIKKQKYEKREKLNVKVPYIKLLISFVICILVVAVSAIFSAI